MIYDKIKPQTLLSLLWVVVLFNTIIRDLHEFLRRGYIEEMMTLKISEETMLLYGFIVELPILMIVLSRIINDQTNKLINITVAVITMLGVLSTLPTADMDDVFFAIVECLALVAIILIARKLSSHSK